VQRKYGGRVKFLNFREVHKRLAESLLCGTPLRDSQGRDNGVRLIDVNRDGFMDVVIANDKVRKTRIWQPDTGKWVETGFPCQLLSAAQGGRPVQQAQFGVLKQRAGVSMIVLTDECRAVRHFENGRWTSDDRMLNGLELNGQPVRTVRAGRDQGVRLRDVDEDGLCELIVSNPAQNAVLKWSDSSRRWIALPFALPEGTTIVDEQGRDAGLRFADLNDDGYDDVVFSNAERWSVHLFDGSERGWSKCTVSGSSGSRRLLPPFVVGGKNNGAWFSFRHVWVQNEHTSKLPDHIARCPFDALIRTGR